jgi:hypothetical protein
VTIPPKLISLNGEHSHLFLDLVDWTQPLKVQSTPESLGSEITLPTSILSQLKPESAGAQLLLKESGLQQKVSNTLVDLVKTRRQLNDLRAVMGINPSLELIMSVQEGVSVDTAQTRSLSQDLESDVVIVDWTHLPMGFTSIMSEFLTMIYRGGRLVRAVFVENITYKYVSAWVENYMDKRQHLYMFSEYEDRDGKTPEDVLHLLDALSRFLRCVLSQQRLTCFHRQSCFTESHFTPYMYKGNN